MGRGRKMFRQEEPFRNGQMGIFMKDNFSKAACMDKENLLGKTRATMKVHGFRMQWKGRVYSFGLIRGVTMENGRIALCISKEFINGPMGLHMKASIISTRSTVSVLTFGQMEINLREIG